MFKNNEIAVILPSYKETRNIGIIIQKIQHNLLGSNIIIVDDSPAKENTEIQSIVKNTKNTLLISRGKKLGRGSAVLTGFANAINNSRIKYFFEIDSDMAHDPAEMGRFLEKLRMGNFDLIVGSRYIKGGKVLGMSFKRIILSKLTNKFLRVLLGAPITDYTGGFRVYKKTAVEFLLKAKLQSTEFITLSESIYKLYSNGFTIGEVPITVYARQNGNSTVNAKLFIHSLLFVIKMRFTQFQILAKEK